MIKGYHKKRPCQEQLRTAKKSSAMFASGAAEGG